MTLLGLERGVQGSNGLGHRQSREPGASWRCAVRILSIVVSKWTGGETSRAQHHSARSDMGNKCVTNVQHRPLF